MWWDDCGADKNRCRDHRRLLLRRSPRRDEAFKQVCTLLGQSRLLKFETGSMRVDAEPVGATDDLIRESEPQLVITHARSGIQNQDHIALHDAVRLSTRRWPSPAIVLGVEPPISSSDFDGNVFCEVGQSWPPRLRP
ncbi:MAG: PIG-L family deacetylase [Candidatus Microthrix sp.]|nr:PIG-L family deacetylase [Candidatus Microthrix sp.]